MEFIKVSWMNCMLISSKIKSFSLNPILISDPKNQNLCCYRDYCSYFDCGCNLCLWPFILRTLPLVLIYHLLQYFLTQNLTNHTVSCINFNQHMTRILWSSLSNIPSHSIPNIHPHTQPPMSKTFHIPSRNFYYPHYKTYPSHTHSHTLSTQNQTINFMDSVSHKSLCTNKIPLHSQYNCTHWNILCMETHISNISTPKIHKISSDMCLYIYSRTEMKKHTLYTFHMLCTTHNLSDIQGIGTDKMHSNL